MSTFATPSLPTPKTAAAHLPLQGDAFLSLLPHSCLAVRAGDVACSACAQACPARVLEVDGDGPRLTGDCLHCGRCSAACPGGALQADGFLDVMLAPGRGPIEVECAKAPASAGSNTMRVPCLGGITPTLLLQWWLQAGDRTLTLINRDWCTHCSAGGPRFAGEASLLQVREWLRECGVASSRWPGVREVASSSEDRRLDIPLAPKKAPSLSRRGFFRRVTTDIARTDAVAEAPAGPRARVLRSPCALPARQRMLESLQQLADRQGCAMPPGALPAVVVSERCRDHGICARVCPTQALIRVERDAEVGLHFDATRCTSCRRCEQTCPEGALSLGHGGFPTSVVVRSTAMSTCIDCGATFAAPQAATTCPRCVARARLARSMFGMGHAEQKVEGNPTR